MTENQIEQAAAMRLEGQTYRAIGKALQVDPMTAYRNTNKDEINHKIKKAQSNIINSHLATTVKNQGLKIALGHKLLKQAAKGEELPKESKTILELADKAESRVLESIGIAGSHTSIQVNNILVDNRQELSPAIESMLTQHLLGNAKVEGNDIEGQIIDAEMVKE